MRHVMLFVLIMMVTGIPFLSAATQEIVNLQTQANQYLKQGDYDKAIQTLKTIVRKDPNNLSHQLQLGLVYANTEKYSDAIKVTRKAASMAPSYQPYYNLGLIYAADQNTTKALESFDEAIHYNPSSYHAYYQKGLVYSSLKELDSARENYRKVISLNPQFEEAYLALGATAFEQGDEKEFQDQITQLKAINPKAAQALENWAEKKKT